MTSPRPHEVTSSAGDIMTPQAVDTGSSTASTSSTTFVGPILTSCQPQMPTPTTMGTMGDTSSSPFPRYQGFGTLETPFDRPLRDLVQKALKEGRLQFGERPKMQVDIDPLKVEEELYVDPLECMIVEATDGPLEVLKATPLAKSF
ncbi:hypothetical protein KIW84_030490 [Lathyrus oleraceus]|uniref:Uncharacterized protein n=1 Tax=Pisum sativum TaxID=3888 RepID=A0A9D5AZI5_PEA|nr:hypothetical protein KIW84_030490 [Pisum sativum]